MLVVGEFQIWGEGRWELQKNFFLQIKLGCQLECCCFRICLCKSVNVHLTSHLQTGRVQKVGVFYYILSV